LTAKDVQVDGGASVQLVAYLNGERVDATQMVHRPWRDLDKHPDYKDLALVECGLRASRVTLGVRQFFRHYRVADCTIQHKSESEQHLAMKRALQDRINATHGWRSRGGTRPNGTGMDRRRHGHP
jgi:hypothetical protein